MKLNMSELETYLNKNVFGKHNVIMYEKTGNPEMLCELDKAIFRYDRRAIVFKGGKTSFTIKHFDYADVMRNQDNITSIKIHTIKTLLQETTVIVLWFSGTV